MAIEKIRVAKGSSRHLGHWSGFEAWAMEVARGLEAAGANRVLVDPMTDKDVVWVLAAGWGGSKTVLLVANTQRINARTGPEVHWTCGPDSGVVFMKKADVGPLVEKLVAAHTRPASP